jgi:putative oxidoreductase
MFKKLLSTAPLSLQSSDLASLLLRVTFGGLMAYNYGSSKFNSYGTDAAGFPDPLHVSPPVSMALTVFAELVCAVLLALGLFTRFAALVLAFCMLVAALAIHLHDPWDVIEHPLLFLVASIVVFFIGAGRYSLDYVLGRFFQKK